MVDACTMQKFSFEDFDMRQPSTVPVSEVVRQVFQIVNAVYKNLVISEILKLAQSEELQITVICCFLWIPQFLIWQR